MKTSKTILNNERGATIIYVAVVIVVLIMFTALAVDIGHLYGVRNELQDAADAGALAGASALLDQNTCELKADEAIAEATRVAQINTTGKVSVVAKSVHIGHWSFHTPSPDGHVFTANLDESPVQIDWKEATASELDANTGYINAVEVVTERTDTPSFFADFFGFDSFSVSSKAVAYRGFAGSFKPGDFDQPIAICEQSITDDAGQLECNVGRMINSGNDPSSSNTGGWTNFTQENSDTGTSCDTANKPTVEPFICGTGNTTELTGDKGIGTTGGEVQTVFDSLLACWEAETNKIENWPMTLPVVDCPANNVSNCATLTGAVSLNVIWMIDNISEGVNKYDDAPTTMTVYDVVYDEHGGATKIPTQSWSNNSADGFTRWQSFVDSFGLKNADGRPSSTTDTEGYEELYQHKAIFFLPNCEFSQAIGGTGGPNMGVCARSPVLVQ